MAAPPRWSSWLVFGCFCYVFVLLSQKSVDFDDRLAPQVADSKSVVVPGVDAQPSSLSEKLVIDKTYIKWLWWPLLIYLFWGMAHVCDEFFVRTIEVISERFDIPDDVAGATLMALGCNGPEMALNTIAIFSPSNIGVGAVVGGEVFNVLVIIGCAMLATPDAYLPLKVGKFSFFRDVIFYIISVAMLYHILKAGCVTPVHSVWLLGGAVVYSIIVAFSSRLRQALITWRKKLHKRRLPTVPDLDQRMKKLKTLIIAEDDFDGEDAIEYDPEIKQQWESLRRSMNPEEGTVVKIRALTRNAMMDRNNPFEARYIWLSRDDGVCISAAVAPETHTSSETGIVFEYGHKTCAWHHAGLVTAPVYYKEVTKSDLAVPELPGQSPGKLSRQATHCPHSSSPLGLDDAPHEIIPWKDVLFLDPVEGDDEMFTLHVHQPGSMYPLTLEILTSSVDVHKEWVEGLRDSLIQQRREQWQEPEVNELREWANWLTFPVRAFASYSIPDMDKKHLQKYYPVAFVMSMAWLAIFAWLVTTACDGVHEDFGISTSVLGFTVAAAGTSFPNVFSGMVVSRQGKTTMAIANSLGANVQNVFLALAIPWTIQSCFMRNTGPDACESGGPGFKLVVAGLQAAIIECYVTLVPVVLIFIACGCRMPRWSGYVYLITYVAYLIYALKTDGGES